MTTIVKTVRTTRGLRDMLFDEIDLLRNGQSNAQKASAVAKLTTNVINSVRLDLDYQRFVNNNTGDGKVANPAAIQLGSN